MKVYLAAVTSKQLRVIDQLGIHLTAQGFYLAGGTALALQLGHPLVQWNAHGCQMAPLSDIACMKLVAIAQRGAKKDFIDLYALLSSKSTSLPKLFDSVQRKYRLGDAGHMLHALTYFADADIEPTPKMLWRVTWPEIKSFIRTAVQTFAHNEL